MIKIILFLSSLFIFTDGSSQKPNYDSLIKDGINAYETGNIKEALSYFKIAHSQDTTRIESYYYSGVVISTLCHENNSSCFGAIEMFTTAINIAPNYRRTYYNRGVCLLKIGYYKDAISDFTNAILLDSINGEAYVNRGVAKINIGELVSGCDDIDRAINLKTPDAQLFKKKYCK